MKGCSAFSLQNVCPPVMYSLRPSLGNLQHPKNLNMLVDGRVGSGRVGYWLISYVDAISIANPLFLRKFHLASFVEAPQSKPMRLGMCTLGWRMFL